MKKLLVLDVVGLTGALVGDRTPRLLELARRGAMQPIHTITPAVTCAVQSTFTTGTMPSEHGCVANGWYFRDLSQVWLWRQSNRLVQGEKIWDTARRRDDRFRCAKLFWWYNMYSTADVSVTPRPIYRADGRKYPDIYSHPASVRDHVVEKLGPFPLFDFWGPRAGIASSQWIGRCAREVHERYAPTLNLVYLPHLDYDLQRFGPDDPRIDTALAEIDAVCGELIDMADRDGLAVVVLSEYGVTAVRGPVHINRALRAGGYLAFRQECGEEHLDPGASRAFAVADHQVAHVYVARPEDVADVAALLRDIPGIDEVLDHDGKREYGLDHARSGELVALSERDRWFTYYWWNDDRRAPDYARTVDIHAKPGYDPAELFIDPKLPLPKLHVAGRLLRSKVLNLRTLLDVIPLDADLVRGSHGRVTSQAIEGPVLISSEPQLVPDHAIAATSIKSLILDHLFEA